MNPCPWLMLALALATTAAAGAQVLPAPLDEATGMAAPASPAQQRAHWQGLDAGARAELRARYRAWRALDPAEQAQLRAAQARLAALPAPERAALQARFDGLDRMYRDGWRLGPRLGAHYVALQPLFGYVPAEQRDVLLALLQSLDHSQLQQLSVLAQRTPPDQRDALRNALLAQPASGRGAWLQAQVGH